MALPVSSRVGRVFKPVATIGPAFWIAGTFIGRGIRRWLLSFFVKSAEEKAKETAERADARMAVELLDLDGLMRDCDQRLVVGDPRERPEPNERELYLQVARLIAGGVVRDYRDAVRIHDGDAEGKPPEPIARRSQHAKHHGCVAAYFIVDDQLPDELAVGVFRRGRRYRAVLRFSNAHGAPKRDGRGDGRGLAIKLLPVDGRGAQDFVLVNHPVFFVDDITEYARFMEIIHSRAGTLMTGLRILFFFVPWRLRKGFIFLKLRSHIGNPLNTTYHSMSVYALGEHVVRYVVEPAGEAPDGIAPDDRPDYLRERLAERLGDGDPAVTDFVAAFDFKVQIRHQPTPDDVEHASRPWLRRVDRTVRLARIEIPPQTFATPDRLCSCENLRFAPWHARPEHRPLGRLNRIRLLVYLASARMRRRLNMVDSK